MRIALLAIGSRGDAQPMVALGFELRRRGHDVVLGLSPNLVALGERAGVETYGLGPDTQTVLESSEGRTWLAAGDARAFLREMQTVLAGCAAQINAEMLEICRGVDLIIAGILTEDRAQCVAEAQHIPIACVHLAPYRSTRAYPHPLVTTRRLPPMLNLATHQIFGRMWWRSARANVAEFRRQLGLVPDATPTPVQLATTRALELQAYSQILTPELTDYPTRRPIVGSFDLDRELRQRLGEDGLDTELEAWLSGGPPPLYFGFGSMPVTDPAGMMDMIRHVTQELGVRALVGAGWSRLGAETISDDQVRVVHTVLNFELVFPRCRLAVHHGGSGTVVASVAAGIPTLVCSVFADNPFWGRRVQNLGVGDHLPFPQLGRETLAVKLRGLLQDSMAARSVSVGHALRANPGGTRHAADLVEREFVG